MRVLTAKIVGHLDKQVLSAALGPLDDKLATMGSEGAAVVFDISAMTSYDGEARTAYIQWQTLQRERLARIAVVTQRTLWHMVIAAIGLASKVSVKTFSTEAEARRWAETG